MSPVRFEPATPSKASDRRPTALNRATNLDRQELILTALNIVLRLHGCDTAKSGGRPFETHVVGHQETLKLQITQFIF
jgi:hypothetical protein